MYVCQRVLQLFFVTIPHYACFLLLASYCIYRMQQQHATITTTNQIGAAPHEQSINQSAINVT